MPFTPSIDYHPPIGEDVTIHFCGVDLVIPLRAAEYTVGGGMRYMLHGEHNGWHVAAQVTRLLVSGGEGQPLRYTADGDIEMRLTFDSPDSVVRTIVGRIL